MGGRDWSRASGEAKSRATEYCERIGASHRFYLFNVFRVRSTSIQRAEIQALAGNRVATQVENLASQSLNCCTLKSLTFSVTGLTVVNRFLFNVHGIDNADHDAIDR